MRARTRLENTLRLVTFTLPALVALGVAFVACGGEQTPPPAKPEPKVETPPPAPTGTPTAEPETPPEPTAKPDAGPPPPPPPASERPPVLMTDTDELRSIFTTSPGAKLELGDDTGRAVFRIREGSLPSPFIVTFKVEPKGKTTGVPIGKVYRLLVQVENSSTLPEVETQDKPYEFTFPAGSKKDANLAIGKIVVDDAGREKLTWTIVAPEKIDDAMGTAFFKIKAIGNYFLHVTAKPPTEAK